MNCIIIIRGVGYPTEYQEIRNDIASQISALQLPTPLFAYLPGDYSDIEVVWLDQEMERQRYVEALRKVNESR